MKEARENIHEQNHENNPKHMWNTVKVLCPTTKPIVQIYTINKQNGSITKHKKEIAEEYVNFLDNIGKTIAQRNKKLKNVENISKDIVIRSTSLK